jgi:serine/threonine protein kinase
MDALVLERLTSSGRIADIYSHCGLAIVMEFFAHGDAEAVMVPYYAFKKSEPERNLTVSEKLRIALDMAEAIADLHGFEDGVIVHNDIQPPQFLFSEDWQMLKLSDFNRAEIMLWDEEHNEYCRYRNGFAPGNVSSTPGIPVLRGNPAAATNVCC